MHLRLEPVCSRRRLKSAIPPARPKSRLGRFSSYNKVLGEGLAFRVRDKRLNRNEQKKKKMERRRLATRSG